MSQPVARSRSLLRLSIRWKLILPFVFIIAAVLLIFLPLTNETIAQRLEHEADDRLSQTAISIGRLLDQTQGQALLASSFLANLPEVETIGNDRILASQVLPARKQELDLQELSYYAADYQAGGAALYYGGPPIERQNVVSQRTLDARDALVAQAREQGIPVSGIVIAPQSSQIIGVAPVTSGDEIRGFIMAVFFIDRTYIEQIGAVLDVDLAIIKDNAVITSTIDRKSGFELMLQNGFIASDGSATSDTVKYEDGIERRLVAHPLLLGEVPQGHVLVARPIQDLFELQQQIQNVILIFVASLIVIMLIFSVAVIVNFANPLRRLVVATEKVRAGQFKERVTASGGLLWLEDEVSDLNHNFNAMTERLEELYTGLEQKVAERTHELSDALKELAVKRDEALDASKTKSLFLANMSHELRTPLNAIIGYSEMLEEEAQDLEYDDIVPDLQKIQKAGKHLLALINDILDISKIEAGKVDLYVEEFELETLLDEIMTTIQPLISQKDNRLVFEAPQPLGKIHSDMTKMRQIIFNLLSNAAKFTEQGTITLNVQREFESGTEWLKVAISDTGIGMDKDQLSKVFMEFMQADSSTTRKYGGTGLGLPISRHFCQMMGGDILVASEVGQGSTFTVRIPANLEMKEVEKPEVHAPMKGQKLETTSKAGEISILVIDDDDTVHDLLRRVLGREGFQVLSAYDGDEGIEKARQYQPNIITLDVMMPSIDGWAVLSKLKSDAALADIPVIMLSMLDNKSLGFALGATDYLTKPVDRNHLINVLHRYHRRIADEQRTGRILIIEDDLDTRELFVRTSEKEGWVTTYAENGLIGLQKLAQEKPDLILLDLMMPEMDGLQFITEMRKNENWHSIPVVVVTAKTLTEDDRKQLNGYVERILQKADYLPSNLMDEIKQILNLHEQL